MTMSLAVAWGRHNIRVNARAHPQGPCRRQLRRRGSDAALWTLPELANLLTFVQADGCDYLTGQTIAIDGGHRLAAPSTFAALGKLTSEDWAEAKAVVCARAAGEGAAQHGVSGARLATS
jgi:hypothetical protein